jgi:muramoyltetrapeptide carboxypeptidase
MSRADMASLFHSCICVSTIGSWNLVKPNALKEGDTIGIISPSFPALARYGHRLERARAALEKLGLHVVLAPNALESEGFVAGDARKRAEDFNWCFSNPEVHGIMAAIGGLNSNAMLPFCDFQVVRNNPKVFVGYSDVTALLLPVVGLSGLVCFHGPAFISEWGEFPCPFDYTVHWFRKALFAAQPIGILSPADSWTDEFLDWDQRADRRPRRLKTSEGWQFLRSGEGSGFLFGGNVDTLNMLAGTRFWSLPQQPIIALIEVTCMKPAAFDRALEQLIQVGLFEKATAVVFGRYHAYDRSSANSPQETTSEAQECMEAILCKKLERYNFPVLSRVDCGHTDPMLTLPLGVLAHVSSGKGIFEIIESAISL